VPRLYHDHCVRTQIELRNQRPWCAILRAHSKPDTTNGALNDGRAAGATLFEDPRRVESRRKVRVFV
jgi:hypothetical protein